MKHVTFREALRFWARLGCISFGGPAGQIAIMQSELVDRLKWIDQGAFLRGLNFCMLLPGPEAQQLATYIGWRLHGWRGAVAAGALFILPGAAVLLLLSWIAAAFGEVRGVAAVFDGIKPVVVAIVLHAVWRVGKRALNGWPAVALAAVAFGLIFWVGVDFPWIVLGAGLIGWFSTHAPGRAFAPVSHGARPDVATEATAGPDRPSGGLRRAIGLILLFAGLWLVPVAVTIGLVGMRPFLDIATFFTRAAFVTFGGAYAVLPYIAEEAVRTFGWLNPGQMLNGLALAETTPGPLILVTQYVGFFAGWNGAGPLPAALAGAVGAGLTTYVTFLPSFLFILLGAPYLARIASHPQAGAALSAITAAVVGVILNLAVYLGIEVFFPQRAAIDWPAVAMALVALGLTLARNTSIHSLVALGALFGVGRWLTAI